MHFITGFFTLSVSFLRPQAIQSQSEIETLQKQLLFCIEEKDKLER